MPDDLALHELLTLCHCAGLARTPKARRRRVAAISRKKNAVIAPLFSLIVLPRRDSPLRRRLRTGGAGGRAPGEQRSAAARLCPSRGASAWWTPSRLASLCALALCFFLGARTARRREQRVSAATAWRRSPHEQRSRREPRTDLSLLPVSKGPPCSGGERVPQARGLPEVSAPRRLPRAFRRSRDEAFRPRGLFFRGRASPTAGPHERNVRWRLRFRRPSSSFALPRLAS